MWSCPSMGTSEDDVPEDEVPERELAPLRYVLRWCSENMKPLHNGTINNFCPSFSISPFLNLVWFSSVTQSCPTVCNPMDWSMPGFPVHHQLPELAQTHVHQIGDVVQPSHPLLSPSPPAFNLSQHQGLFQWVSSSHQVAKVLEFQLQHQSFQWIFRYDIL